MRCKKVISALVIVGIVAAAAGFAWYTHKVDEKEQLAMETFAPQFNKVQDLRTRFIGQLKVKFAAEGTSEDQREELVEIVNKHLDAVNAHILEAVLDTYTVEELQSKRDFEAGEYMDQIMNANSEINVAIKVYAQHLNRIGTMESLRANFDQEKGADELREVILKLSKDRITPDEDRLNMIADELNIPKQQAMPVLILLALSKQAIEMQDHYLNPSFEGKDPEYVEAAKRYVVLNQLNTMLENNENFLSEREDADFTKINAKLENILAAVVMKHVDHETLSALNMYFETEAAQTILKKDVKLAGEMGPHIKGMIEEMNASLMKAIEMQATEEAAEIIEEEAEELADDAEEAKEEAEEAIEEAADVK